VTTVSDRPSPYLQRRLPIAVPFAYFLAAFLLLQTYYLLLPLGLGTGLLLYPVITLVVAAGTGTVGLWGGRLLLPVLWVVAAVLQNVLIGVYLNGAPEVFDRLLLPLFEIKSVILFFAFGALIVVAGLSFNRLPIRVGDAVFAAFLLLVLFAFFHSPAPLVARLSYLRNFTAFVLLYLLGKWLNLNPEDRRRFLGFLVFAVGGTLTMMSIVDLLWPHVWPRLLSIDRIEAAKGPISQFSDFLGSHLRRLKSGVGEPVNAGYLFACLTLVALCARHRVWATLFGIQLILTFAKGPMLICGVGVLLWAYVRLARIRGFIPSPTIWIWVLVGVLGGSGVYVILTSLSRSFTATSTWWHFVGLAHGLINMVGQPMGQGLGTGGNYRDVAGFIGAAARPEESQWIGSGAESAIGVVGTQLGIPGLALFALALIVMVRNCWRSLSLSVTTGGPELTLATVACGGLGGICLTSFLQESALSPQAAGLFFLVAGMSSAKLTEPSRSAVGSDAPSPASSSSSRVR